MKNISYFRFTNSIFVCLLLLATGAVQAAGSRVTTHAGSAGLSTQFFEPNCVTSGCHDGTYPDWSVYANADASSATIDTRINLPTSDPLFMPSGGCCQLDDSLFQAWLGDSKPQYQSPYINDNASQGATSRTGTNQYSVSVSFTVNENGADSSFTVWYREDGVGGWSSVSGSNPGGTGGSGSVGSDGTSTATLTGLQCGTVYEYYMYGNNIASGDTTTSGNPDSVSAITCNTGASISGTPGSVDEDSTINWTPTITAGTGGSDSLTFSFSAGPTVTGGDTLNVPTINPSSGQISWTPTEGNTQASFTIQVSDADADTGITDTLAVSITANPINENTPSIDNSNASPFGALENSAMTPIQFTATDADTGDTQTWSLTAQDDPGMAITSGGEFSWTPAEGDAVGGDGAGNFQFTVQAEDTYTPASPGLHTITKTFTIAVTADNSPPTIDSTPIATQSATEDTLFSIDLNVTDTDVPESHTWSITSPASPPDDMAIDTNGTLTWTPGEGIDRTQSVTIQVMDSASASDSTSFDIDVTSVNDAPTIDTVIPDDSVEEHSAFAYTLDVSDSDPLDNSPDLNSNLTFSITNVSPTPNSAGPAIDANGQITWTPGDNDARTVDPAALSQDYTISVSVADGGEDSQTPATQDFTLTVTLLDGDTDTVPDYEDNCPATINTDQANNDGDADGDLCDPDDDNDGISDIAENFNGLDPFDDSDALLDLDGDGLNNLTEFNTCTGADINSLLECDNIQIDSVPPVITHNGDQDLVAKGLTTFVDFYASAVDGLDGVVSVSSDVQDKLFKPGDNVITWTASDSAGNITVEEQYITIHPILSLGGSQILSEGTSGTVNLVFNGDIPAADYPVDISYELGGNSNGFDYLITPSSPVTINDPSDLTNNQFEMTVDTIDDGLGESVENLVIKLDFVSDGPKIGSSKSHEIFIVEGQVAPTANMSAQQNGITTNVIFGDQGTVTVNANAVDGNGDVLYYKWGESDAKLLEIATLSGDQFSFDPSSLTPKNLPKTYTVAVEITDNTDTINTQMILSFQGPTLNLGAVDTDGDGVNDDVEGLGDSDGDGIADYLDPYDNPPSMLYSGNGTSEDEAIPFIQTETGYVVSAGLLSQDNSLDNPKLNLSLLELLGLNSKDKGYVHFGSAYDFIIEGLNEFSDTTSVVIPLEYGMPPGTEVRVFNGKRWSSFVENGKNTIYSASSDENGCPAPGSSDYEFGITPYSDCLMLEVSDGGPNDIDGTENGSISLIVGLALPEDNEIFEPENVVDESNLFKSDGPAGTGALLWYLIILSLAATSNLVLRKK